MSTKTRPTLVTKTFLPPIEEYRKYMKKIWDANQLTNQGPLLKQFESKIRKYLKVDYFHFVTNGTIALQLALKALDITDGEVITTPFSYVATTSAILWERCRPVYVDIDPNTLCIDASKIEKAITKNTKAILAVHVFGYPCDVDRIDRIAKKYNLKLIYDAAHAFGAVYKGKSLMGYGDVSVGSFHSTKVFHTIEGGCLITKNKKISDRIELIKRFGHNGDDHIMLGTNGKASEFQAAMGLCNIGHLNEILRKRKAVIGFYDKYLKGTFGRPKMPEHLKYNFAYYPVLLKDEKMLVRVRKELKKENIFPRRYFFPSLNTLPYLDPDLKKSCPVSEDVSSRILCLPLYPGLEKDTIDKICRILIDQL